MLASVEKFANKVKDGYLWLAQKVSDHPHIVIVSWPVSLYLAIRFL